MANFELLNQTLFLWINATDPLPWQVTLARIGAEDLVWLLPPGLVLGWLYSTAGTRLTLISAALAAALGLALNQLIALFWYHARPFEMGLGRTLIDHATESSFPSDHYTLFMAVACSLLLYRPLRQWGLWLALLGTVVAWARIYAGVHFPLDMAGALLVGGVSASVLHGCRPWMEHHFMGPLLGLYRLLGTPLIQKGWIRK